MHDLFKKRRSHRVFSEEDVSEEQIQSIINAAMVSPCAIHVKTWSFVVVKDKQKIKELSKVGSFQSFIKNAPCLIVIASEENNWWIENSSIAAAHIYLEATNQGLATCWANIRDGSLLAGKGKEKYVKDVLHIPNKYRVLCIMPVGYPLKELPAHSDADYVKKKVHFEEW